MYHLNKALVLGALVAATSAFGHPGHTDTEQPDKRSVRSPQQPPAPGDAMHPEPMERIELPAPEFSITIEDDKRIIRSNGIPNHATGEFPNKGNPNAIRPLEHEVTLPLHPVMNTEPVRSGPEFGIAVNGIPFDAGTGEFWSADGRRFQVRSAWNYEAIGGGVDLGLDENNAHVQPTGKYHYHGLPNDLLSQLGGEQGTRRMLLIGWAYDGFPIYGPYGYQETNDADSKTVELRSSYQLKKGTRPESPEGPGGEYDGQFGRDWEYIEGSGDLDECNGRFGVTPEFPEGTYYYVLTNDFPFVPRLLRGTPSRSAMPNRPPDGQPPQPRLKIDH